MMQAQLCKVDQLIGSHAIANRLTVRASSIMFRRKME